ncbi:MAG: hypothetical protein KDC56_00430 [Flavobacteriaceae bacterium]|nr:hypothetical protein [Flavobacteriaceae bacterium]
MTEKKNIDRLFQEKFKDYEVKPDPVVWQNIERKLNRNRRKKVLPLWWRFAGVAAVLLLMMTISYRYFTPGKSDIDPQEKQQQIIVDDHQNATDNPNNQVEIGTNTDIDPVDSDRNPGSKTADQKNPVAKQTNSHLSPEPDPVIAEETRSDNAIAAEQSHIADKPGKTNPVEIHENELKASEAIPEETLIATSDEKKDIEEELKNKSEEEIKLLDKTDKKWSVGSVISPIYYNSLSNGSPVDAALAGNTKNSLNTLAYGVKVDYQLSDRITLQSGIHNIAMGYRTDNVAVIITSKVFSNTNSNINSNFDGAQVSTVSTAQYYLDETSASRSSADLSGSMDQTLGYVEIPMEVKYNLLDRKLGINFIGGVSSYILYENNITMNTFSKKQNIGEASNINTLNFSGNLGLDFDYDLSKNIYINVSPMFKYQFNTYSKGSGGFKPYLFGVYTGLNFRF